MQKKQVSIIPKSMQQDLAVSQFPADAAYNLRNMRIVTTGDDTSLCLVNEKSNLNTKIIIDGTVLGVQVINDYAIVFSKSESSDNICKVYLQDGKLVKQDIFSGNLGFSVNNPIESIGIYETENIQKVYWVDGINQPRVINVSDTGIERIKPDDIYQFDFLPRIADNTGVDVDIEKLKLSGGNFPAGVVQYAISYFNLYGQQTGIIYQSPLLYTSADNRGLSPEDKSSDSFSLRISNLNKQFEYIRVYRLIWTSINATPSAEIVGDYKVNDSYTESQVTRTSLTSNRGDSTPKIKSIRYDIEVTSNSTIDRAFAENEKRLIVLDDPSNTLIIDQSYDESTQKEVIIQYTENGKEYTFTIPRNKSVYISWESSTTRGWLNEKYSVYIAEKGENGEWFISSESLITGKSEYKDGVIVVDSGTTGTTIDPTEILYLGGEPIHPYTLSHKDNTLFLGNIKLNRRTISESTKEFLKSHSNIYFDYVTIGNTDEQFDLNTQYLYSSNLDKTSKDITFFQKGETYRIGVQFLHNTGSWSEVVYLGDFENDKRVIANSYNDTIAKKPVVRVSLDISSLRADGYIASRLVCVYPTDNDRTVLCQGVVLPTVYNIYDRVDNSPYAQSSWFARPSYYNHYTYNDYISAGGTPSKMFEYRQGWKGFPIEYRMSDSKSGIVSMPTPDKYNAEVQYGIDPGNTPYQVLASTDEAARIIEANKYASNFGVDKTIVTFHSPELDANYTDWMQNIPLDNIKFRVVGYVPVKTTLSDLTVSAENPFNPTVGKFYWSQIEDPSSSTHISGMSLSSFPFWVDSVALNKDAYQPEDREGYYWYASFPIYPWHRAGSLNNQGSVTDPDTKKSVLKHKVMSNLRIGLPTRYLDKSYDDLQISNIELFNSEQVEVKRLKVWGKEINYYGNVDKALTVEGATSQPIYLATYTLSNSDSAITDSNGNISPSSLVNGSHTVYTSDRNGLYKDISQISLGMPVTSANAYAIEGLPIKYKSTSHAVFAFEKDENGNYVLLPNIVYSSNSGSTSDEDNIKVNLSVSAMIVRYGSYNPQYPNSPGNLVIGDYDRGEDVGTQGLMTLEAEGDWKIAGVTPYILSFSLPSSDISLKGDTLYINDSVLIRHYNNISPNDPEFGSYAEYQTEYPSKSVTLRVGTNGSYWGNSISRIDVRVTNGEVYKTITFNFTGKGDNLVIPTVSGGNNATASSNTGSSLFGSSINESYQNSKTTGRDKVNLLWEKADESFTGFSQHSIVAYDPTLSTVSNMYNDLFYFVVGEFYRDSIVNRFGGNSDSAILSNTWVPCGKTVYFTGDSIALVGDQGDTYFERYDHLKTYSFTEEDTNSVVDIVSFCVETRINIDGRYDKNRGQQSNVAVSPTNFNLFNSVYSQKNNFFHYNTIDDNIFSSSTFPMQVTWSKTKTIGENIDTWTNITLASVLDLDGDKGELQALRRFNNDIYAFQDTGISKVIFNPRVQINASDGVPIEIANSGKVDGKVYLTDKYGCQNKWSITETPSGLYFVDDLNQAILSFNGQNIIDLAYTKNMYSWINSNVSKDVWNPKEYSAIRTFYDRNNSDIYFTTKTDSLAFSERLGAFSSFYDYGKVDWMFNIEGNTYQIKDNVIWKAHGGEDYGNFFGENKEYSLTIVANPEFQLDKIFDTVEFRTNGVEHFTNWEADSYPFNFLITTNEYQTAVSTTSSLKKKFRTWRWQVGRNNPFGKFKRDRIRNPWAKITMSGNSSKEVRLYDIAVTYYT